MRHYRWSLLALGAVLLLAAGLSSAAPPKKCPAGKLVRVIDGARGCAPAKAFRPQITTLSPAAALFRQELGSRLVKLRLKNGRVIQAGIPRRFRRTQSPRSPRLRLTLSPRSTWRAPAGPTHAVTA